MTDFRDAAQTADARSPEVLSGAEAIAVYLFGEKRFRRKVYYLVQRHALPVFRIGANVCARKNALSEWLKAKEAAGA